MQIALEQLLGLVEAEIGFQAYELKPDMPAKGESGKDHVAWKYGASDESAHRSADAIRQQARALGLEIAAGQQARIWNTFDAHRLPYWAGQQKLQLALAVALFHAHFAESVSLADHDALAHVAAEVGLDPDFAREVLGSGRYGDAVRAEERRSLGEGVRSVPYIVINDRYVINGGQPPETFERALPHIAAGASARQDTCADTC